MMALALLGAAEIDAAPLPDLHASSATGLEVARWAEKPARLARMDRLCALGLVACDAALVRAGLDPSAASWRPERTGVVLGTAFGSHATNEAYYRGHLSPEGPSPRLFAYTLPSSPVGEITIHHRIFGPSSTTISGLAAGLDAVREALRHLQNKRADRMLVAAADVATPMLQRLGYVQSRDRAAALVLETGPAVMRLSAASRHVRGDCASAARAAIAALDPRSLDEVRAHERVLPTITSLFPHARVIALADDAIAPVAAIATIHEQDVRAALIVAADPGGQVSALRIERPA